MKRSTVLLISCLTIATTTWLGHLVWGQPPETKKSEATETKGPGTDAKDETYTITKSKLEEYIGKRIAKALADEREKTGHDKVATATDEQVLKPENWHRAVFNKAEYVVYTGTGQAMFHHWVAPAAKSPEAKGGATPPASKAR